ncbi:MAG: hypothetical protein M3Q45_01565 [Chloroflexota bacterium]|nr:hypothetical protein [Chloroflexota bacterium]
MADRNFQFVSLTMAVILGVLLTQTSTTMIEEFSLRNAKAILLVLALLIFLEMYIVLVRYHQLLDLEYQPIYFFFDLLIGLLFVTFVELIGKQLGTAMLLLGVIFVLLALRQLITYRKIAMLDTKVEKLSVPKKELLFPIIADFLAIPICIAIYLAERNGSRFLSIATIGWAWLGIGLFIVYLLSVYVIKLELRTSV